MKKSTLQLQKTQGCKGLSLIEITVVIGLMLALASMVTYSITSMESWRKGRSASESLQRVYVAQKGFLADHPNKDSSDFSLSALVSYLPGNSTSMPQAKSLEDDPLTLDFSVVPPVWKLAGSTYDPSDDPNDGMWDVGRFQSLQTVAMHDDGSGGLTNGAVADPSDDAESPDNL